MHTHSLPPTDRDEELPATYACNSALRDALRAMRDAAGSEWSNAKFARRLGCNIAIVSQYLNDEGNKYPGDTTTLERKIDDFLRNEGRRRASGIETTKTEVSEAIQAALEYIRRTNGVGEILAAPGEGKTRALELYLANNPTSVLFHVRSWSRDIQSVEAAVFESVGRSGYDNRTKRAIFVAQKLRGSNRLLIVDDAHKLTRPALQWLFDMHDETLCPVAFVGTPELEDTLNADSQRSSRVGYSSVITSKDARPLITHMVKQLVPNANGEAQTLVDLCEDVAREHGHYRNVHQQLKLAVELHEAAPKLSWSKAFAQAATMMPNRPKR